MYLSYFKSYQRRNVSLQHAESDLRAGTKKRTAFPPAHCKIWDKWTASTLHLAKGEQRSVNPNVSLHKKDRRYASILREKIINALKATVCKSKWQTSTMHPDLFEQKWAALPLSKLYGAKLTELPPLPTENSKTSICASTFKISIWAFIFLGEKLAEIPFFPTEDLTTSVQAPNFLRENWASFPLFTPKIG